MTGTILLGVGCFALGGLVGFYSALILLAHSVAHNIKGVRDTLKKSIAKAEGMDRAERAMQAMLDELKAKKVQS
jgi:hypothetical protein